MKVTKIKVRCNRALDSICPLKNKCKHFKIHTHKGNLNCGKSDCFLDGGGEKKIEVECIEVEDIKKKSNA